MKTITIFQFLNINRGSENFAAWTFLMLMLLSNPLSADESKVLNGFDLSDFDYPLYDVFQGGPPRDGIPSIDYPKFLSTEQASFLRPSDVLSSCRFLFAPAIAHLAFTKYAARSSIARSSTSRSYGTPFPTAGSGVTIQGAQGC